MKMSSLVSKQITVLCGPSGVGKTYERTYGKYSDLPYIDIADCYRQGLNKTDALLTVIEDACQLLEHHDHILIEGYFLPNSPSKNILNHHLSPVANLNFINLYAPYKICVDRLVKDKKNGKISVEEFNIRSKLLRLVKGNYDFR